MTGPLSFNAGSRALQDAFGSRALADRLNDFARREFSPDDRAFVEGAIFFFLATADESGRPDCSFKGGAPGFVSITGPTELAFPDFDGNGMFRSLGNIAVNPAVALLFIAMGERPRRLRVNGRASVSDRDPLLATTPGAQLMVRVAAEAIFPNCPRYIPSVALKTESPYVPRPDGAIVEPDWKGYDDFAPIVPPRRPTAR